jgi:hypothetical protein
MQRASIGLFGRLFAKSKAPRRGKNMSIRLSEARKTKKKKTKERKKERKSRAKGF